MSSNQKRFWRALDRLAGGAVMAEWTRELGDELEWAQPLLRLLPGLAASHPCMNVLGCGEPHWAEEIEPGRWAAVGGPEHSCPPFRLERKDLFVFGLDAGRLGSRIAGALGLGAINGRKPGQVRAEVVGAYGAAGWPVYLMLPGDSARMMREVERLFGVQPDPFVLLTPTGVHSAPDVETCCGGSRACTLRFRVRWSSALTAHLPPRRRWSRCWLSLSGGWRSGRRWRRVTSRAMRRRRRRRN